MGNEAVRSWYERTTRFPRRLVSWSILGVAPAGLVLYTGLPQTLHLGLQVFNGAYTIPAVAAIWIYAFVYLFLVPSRESGFRSVESIERTENHVVTFINEQFPAYWEKDVKPVLEIWKRLGERLEKRFDESRIERLLKSLEDVVEISAPVGAVPVPLDGRLGLGAWNHRPAALSRKEDAP